MIALWNEGRQLFIRHTTKPSCIVCLAICGHLDFSLLKYLKIWQICSIFTQFVASSLPSPVAATYPARPIESLFRWDKDDGHVDRRCHPALALHRLCVKSVGDAVMAHFHFLVPFCTNKNELLYCCQISPNCGICQDHNWTCVQSHHGTLRLLHRNFGTGVNGLGW